MATRPAAGLLCLLTLMTYTSMVTAGNILLYPNGHCYNSHLRLMAKLGALLARNGHTITTLISSNITVPSHHHDSEGTGGQANEQDYDDMQTVLSGSKKAAKAHGWSIAPRLLTFTPPSGVRTLCDLNVAGGEGESMSATVDVQMKAASAYCDALLSDVELTRRLTSARFDLVIVDVVELCNPLVLERVGTPHVTLQSISMPQSDAELAQYLHVPSMFLPHTHQMTFLQRLASLTINLGLRLARHLVHNPALQKLRTRHGLRGVVPKITGADEVSSHAVLRLVNEDFAIDYPRLLSPESIPIGLFFIDDSANRRNAAVATVGQTPRVDTQLAKDELPEVFRRFLSTSADQDVIVVSFGSQVSRLAPELDSAFCEAMRSLPYRFIWRRSGGPCLEPSKNAIATSNIINSTEYNRLTGPLSHDNPNETPLSNNVLTSTWLPQSLLVASRTTRLLITHAGASSLREASHWGVPVLAIPLTPEEHYQAAKITKHHGAGLTLTPQQAADAHVLSAAIRQVAEKSTYTAAAQRISSATRGHPKRARQQILNSVEFILLRQALGKNELNGPMVAEGMAWYQILMLDVYGTVAILFITLAAIVLRLLKALVSALVHHLLGVPKRSASVFKMIARVITKVKIE